MGATGIVLYGCCMRLQEGAEALPYGFYPTLVGVVGEGVLDRPFKHLFRHGYRRATFPIGEGLPTQRAP